MSAASKGEVPQPACVAQLVSSPLFERARGWCTTWYVTAAWCRIVPPPSSHKDAAAAHGGAVEPTTPSVSSLVGRPAKKRKTADNLATSFVSLAPGAPTQLVAAARSELLHTLVTSLPEKATALCSVLRSSLFLSKHTGVCQRTAVWSCAVHVLEAFWSL